MLADTQRFMKSSTFKRVAMGAFVVLLASGLSSCGRRGSLEAPPSETVITTDEQGNEIKKVKPKEDKPFILDPLL